MERCGLPLRLDTIEACCSAEAYRRFLDFRADRFVQTGTLAGTLRRCPAPRCDYAFEPAAGPSSQPFACPKCRGAFCLSCAAHSGDDGPAHPGRTCAAQAARLVEEAGERRRLEEWQAANAGGEEALGALMREEGWRRCPKCATPIARDAGCDHMTCRACRCNFCYVCGKWDPARPEARGDCGTTCRRRRPPA